jgi:hypothetical protein
MNKVVTKVMTEAIARLATGVAKLLDRRKRKTAPIEHRAAQAEGAIVT